MNYEQSSPQGIESVSYISCKGWGCGALLCYSEGA